MEQHSGQGQPELQKKETQEADFSHRVIEKVSRVFPSYSIVDRSEYDTVEPPENLLKRGRILAFYTEQGKEPDAPVMQFIFMAAGFVVNYNNASSPLDSYLVSNTNNSVYAPQDRRWQEEELDFSLEKTKIHMEGINPEDPLFRNQIAGWNDEEKRFLTLGERIDTVQQYKAAKGAGKKRIKPQYDAAKKDIWDITLPEEAKRLVVARINQHNRYTTFTGEEYDSSEIIQEIENESEKGRAIMQRELHRIEAYERLLKDKRLLQ